MFRTLAFCLVALLSISACSTTGMGGASGGGTKMTRTGECIYGNESSCPTRWTPG